MRFSTPKAAFAGLSATAMLFASDAQAATSPWFGVWKLKAEHPGEKPETLVYSDAGGGAMRMVSIENKGELVTYFDGKPCTDLGSASHHDSTLAIKSTSAMSYVWTFSRSGHAVAQGRNTLAGDLKTFNEVSWAIGHPDKTISLTYVRQ